MIRTWQGELAAVAAVLGAVLFVTKAPLVEVVGSGAVLASFAHGQVSDRLAETDDDMIAALVEIHESEAK